MLKAVLLERREIAGLSHPLITKAIVSIPTPEEAYSECLTFLR
jgi:hypothetical protein